MSVILPVTIYAAITRLIANNLKVGDISLYPTINYAHRWGPGSIFSLNDVSWAIAYSTLRLRMQIPLL